ncbi:MAG: tetratricopeptide repeat protein [Candidatus Poribacteria bacterium]
MSHVYFIHGNRLCLASYTAREARWETLADIEGRLLDSLEFDELSAEPGGAARPTAEFLGEALALAKGGDHEGAAALRASADPAELQSAPALLALAEIHYYAGNVDEAQEHAEAAVELGPAAVQPRLTLAWLAISRGDSAAAVATLREGIRLSDPDPVLYATLGSALAEGGLWKEAIAAAEHALELDDGESEAWVTLGRARLERGEFDAAIEKFKRATAVEPRAVRGHFFLADAYMATGRFGESESELQMAAVIAPEDLDVRIALGVCYGAQGEYPAAIDTLKIALIIDPENVAAHIMLATAHREIGSLDEALKLSQEAARLDPSNAVIQLGIGQIHTQQGRRAEAIRAYRAAIQLDPESVMGLNGLAWEYSQVEGRREEAISVARQPCEYPNAQYLVFTSLASLYANDGQMENAAAALQRARQLKPAATKKFRSRGDSPR